MGKQACDMCWLALWYFSRSPVAISVVRSSICCVLYLASISLYSARPSDRCARSTDSVMVSKPPRFMSCRTQPAQALVDQHTCRVAGKQTSWTAVMILLRERL